MFLLEEMELLMSYVKPLRTVEYSVVGRETL